MGFWGLLIAGKVSRLRSADSPEPTPKTTILRQGYGRQVSRRGVLKFRLLAKLISGFHLWLGFGSSIALKLRSVQA